ncbi:Phosphatidate cytidylyltransferase [hydrothermal vent metagenome]|uniref:Phosphatidate cytidylyltransferase n=1 Tax=hydrothermal vent metagenome TaxID=652676 RepID=A0A3B1DZS3_9ZZZZ
MLHKRLIMGTLLIAGLVLGLWLDEVVDGLALPGFLADLLGHETFPPGTVMFVIVIGLSFEAARELAAMLGRKGIAASARVSCGAALVGLLVSTFVPEAIEGTEAVAVVATAAAVVLFASMVFHSRRQSVEGVMAATGGTLLAFVYLGLMFGFLLAIRRHHEVWTVLWVLIVTKSCDIGAYFTGRAIGRHKLIPWLSPGKTWEGLAGGMVVASLVGAGGAWLLDRSGVVGGPGPLIGAFAGLLFANVGQAGDLMASMLKRDAGVKDSGTAVPGMGGLIDVLDSPLLVFPAAYWLLTLAS